jgi:hypothetical protein
MSQGDGSQWDLADGHVVRGPATEPLKMYDVEESDGHIESESDETSNREPPRAIAFKTRDTTAYIHPDRNWKTGFIGGDYQWLIDGGRNLDARTCFFYLATVNTPAMAAEMIGVGSQYALTETDSAGDHLDGGERYRLRLPANAPAKQFWSLVVYDPQTRSELQSGQTFPGRNSMRDDIVYNDDGSADITFGPTEPAEHSSNWIQTVAGKGWFVVLRLYGPLEPWFERTWKPNDVERI